MSDSSNKEQNLALIFKEVPTGLPVAGTHLVVEDIGFDQNAALPDNSISVEVLYLALDPYQRGRMRSPDVKAAYNAGFTIGKPIDNSGLARVLKATSTDYKEGQLVKTWLPFAQFAVLQIDKLPAPQKPIVIDVESGPEDVRHWLGCLGMTGLTAYSSLYEIGQPKAGETIFVSSAAGAVGQVVGAIAKREGLKVIGSVGSDEKLKYIVDECGFDGGFNYKKEKPADALARLAPDGIDIYYENVGGEHLEAALDALKQFGRIVTCGMISQYNKSIDDWQGPRNIYQIIGKRLTMRGFIVSDANMGPKHAKEHREKVGEWLKDGSFKARVHEWVGIDNGAAALIGVLQGENFGRAVLKVNA